MASAILSAPVRRPGIDEPFAWPARRPFLTAEWRNLVVLNYEVDPSTLGPYVPPGTELDYWEGSAFASVVGFQFLKTRLAGIAVPFHTAFDEVNLRFYVRRPAANGWRRGVVFIRELAPRRLVAVVARLCYGENYLCVPVNHRFEQVSGSGAGGEIGRRWEYHWRYRGRPSRVTVEASREAGYPAANSLEEYIIEHYWGYSAPARCREYEVAHPRWRIAPATTAEFVGDAAAIYGRQWTAFLTRQPASAFWADGSAVRVFPGTRITGT